MTETVAERLTLRRIGAVRDALNEGQAGAAGLSDQDFADAVAEAREYPELLRRLAARVGAEVFGESAPRSFADLNRSRRRLVDAFDLALSVLRELMADSRESGRQTLAAPAAEIE